MPLSLSILDLAPVSADSTSTQALHHSIELARLADQLGYTRYWLAEHHNIPGIAISTPEIMISVIARETQRIRVGSGGIMLPNHASLKVAEWFRTLAALYPGRIDLGIGRAPGTDQLTAYALRGSEERLKVDNFPEQLAELQAFGADGNRDKSTNQSGFPDDHPYRRIRVMPAGVDLPPIWLLGSSGGYSAQIAATAGIGFAFAYHINPNLETAIAAFDAYRHDFSPSTEFAAPHTILALGVLCADSEEKLHELRTVADLMFVRRQRGEFVPLPTVAEALAYRFTPVERAQAEINRGRQLIDTPANVRTRLEALAAQTGADEIMLLSMTSDHAARLRSYELLAAEFGLSAH